MTRSRVPFDVSRLKKKVDTCFICEFLSGNIRYKHFPVAETETGVAFLNRFPTLEGYVLVAPKEHLEEVTGSFSLQEYQQMQALVYAVSEGLREYFSPERIYILSLGSQLANAHVHWHVAPLPKGIPLDEQQYHALMHENGALDMTETELSQLAIELRPVIAKYISADT